MEKKSKGHTESERTWRWACRTASAATCVWEGVWSGSSPKLDKGGGTDENKQRCDQTLVLSLSLPRSPTQGLLLFPLLLRRVSFNRRAEIPPTQLSKRSNVSSSLGSDCSRSAVRYLRVHSKSSIRADVWTVVYPHSPT